jgi:hypothetical protein
MKWRTVVPAVLLLTGCGDPEAKVANGDDPIAALAVTVPSTRYGLNYWRQKSRESGDVWRRAVTYCEGRDYGTNPNCAAVGELRRMEAASERTRERPPPLRETRDVQLGRPEPKHTLPRSGSTQP